MEYNSPSKEILEKCRKKYWSAWFATLSPRINHKKSSFNPVNQPDETVFFYPVYSSKSIIYNFPDNIDTNEWSERLSQLRKSECICLSKEGLGEKELGPTRYFVIKIDSLEERMED